MIDSKLARLVNALQQDQDYGDLERLEMDMREHVRRLTITGEAGTVAELAQRLGFLLKYKPYGVKCSTLLGHSIFFLNPNEGFSFQLHTAHKTELFHFIDVLPGGYAFVGEQKDVLAMGNEGALKSWWEEKNGIFDRFVKVPRPGDAINVERTGIVHTVIGCVFEEYANVSTDMVERLFDQNAGRPVRRLGRARVLSDIAALRVPVPKMNYMLDHGLLVGNPVEPLCLSSRVREYVLHRDEKFTARRVVLSAGADWVVDTDPSFVSLFCSEGSATLVSTGQGEKPMILHTSEVSLLIPGSHWQIRSDGPCVLSVLNVPESEAFPQVREPLAVPLGEGLW